MRGSKVLLHIALLDDVFLILKIPSGCEAAALPHDYSPDQADARPCDSAGNAALNRSTSVPRVTPGYL